MKFEECGDSHRRFVGRRLGEKRDGWVQVSCVIKKGHDRLHRGEFWEFGVGNVSLLWKVE